MTFHCDNCNKDWAYPIKKCIFCGGNTRECVEKKYVILGCTQINTPSQGNEKVPYYSYLLEDILGKKRVWKSPDKYEVGITLEIENIRSVRVIPDPGQPVQGSP
jgi:hypothetical protein